jgi:uncharacterized membrane protein
MGQSEWNAGTSSVGDVWSNLGTVAGELKWPIFGLYVVGFLLVCIAIGVVFAASQPFTGLLLSGEDVNWLLLVGGWGGAWLISGTVFFGLLGTGRRALLEGDRPGGLFATCGDFFRRTPKVFVAVLLVTIAQCMVICLPGLVFGALSPVPYLAATRDDLSISDAFWEGVGWLKRHIVTLGVSYALVTLAYGVAYMLMWGVMTVVTVGLSEFAGEGSRVVTVGLGTIGFIALQFMNYVGIASAFYTIDAAESGLSVHASDPREPT